MLVFVRASRRARAYTRSAVAQTNRVTRVLTSVENRIYGKKSISDTRKRQLHVLQRSLENRKEKGREIVAGKYNTGYALLGRGYTHGGRGLLSTKILKKRSGLLG